MLALQATAKSDYLMIRMLVKLCSQNEKMRIMLKLPCLRYICTVVVEIMSGPV